MTKVLSQAGLTKNSNWDFPKPSVLLWKNTLEKYAQKLGSGTASLERFAIAVSLVFFCIENKEAVNGHKI